MLPSDESAPTQEDFTFKKVLKTIASLSGAKSGPPKIEGDAGDFPIRMRSQIAPPPQETLIALETTEAVKNAILKRQSNFQREDFRARMGQTLSRLHPTAPI